MEWAGSSWSRDPKYIKTRGRDPKYIKTRGRDPKYIKASYGTVMAGPWSKIYKS